MHRVAVGPAAVSAAVVRVVVDDGAEVAGARVMRVAVRAVEAAGCGEAVPARPRAVRVQVPGGVPRLVRQEVQALYAGDSLESRAIVLSHVGDIHVRRRRPLRQQRQRGPAARRVARRGPRRHVAAVVLR